MPKRSLTPPPAEWRLRLNNLIGDIVKSKFALAHPGPLQEWHARIDSWLDTIAYARSHPSSQDLCEEKLETYHDRLCELADLIDDGVRLIESLVVASVSFKVRELIVGTILRKQRTLRV